MVKQGLGENMKDWNNSIKNPNIRRTDLIKLIHLYTGNICMSIICQPQKKTQCSSTLEDIYIYIHTSTIISSKIQIILL